MTIIDALKERLEELSAEYKRTGCYKMSRGVGFAISELDSFQSERTWHDPAERLPEDGAKVWVHLERMHTRWAHAEAEYVSRGFVGWDDIREKEFEFTDVKRWTPRYVDTPPPTPEEG